MCKLKRSARNYPSTIAMRINPSLSNFRDYIPCGAEQIYSVSVESDNCWDEPTAWIELTLTRTRDGITPTGWDTIDSDLDKCCQECEDHCKSVTPWWEEV